MKAVSKLQNVEIFDAKNYKKKENSICDNMELNCSVYLVINDSNILKVAKERIEKKRVKTQKKLEDLMKQMHNKKYSSEASDEEKLKNQEKVSINCFFFSF